MRSVATLRLAAALAGFAAIIATLLDTASRSSINPFNFFGFFTVQSNIFFCVTMTVTAAVTFRGRRQGMSLALVRGCVTTYIVLVGGVYNVLLAGQEGGVTLPWANTVLHVVLPLYGVIDWILFSDRPPLPWRQIWVTTIYPVGWMVVVLIRGATDGWVPYPFLDPTTGYATIAVYCFAIAAFTMIVAAGVWSASRLTLVTIAGGAAHQGAGQGRAVLGRS